MASKGEDLIHLFQVQQPAPRSFDGYSEKEELRWELAASQDMYMKTLMKVEFLIELDMINDLEEVKSDGVS